MSNTTFPLLSIARHRMGTDGAGITTLVAGAGCPLRCAFCINKKLLQETAPQNILASELLERVRADDLYFRATGGGITFGGGEALLHADFMVHYEGAPADERAFVTAVMTEREYEEAVKSLSSVKQCIRLLQD